MIHANRSKLISEWHKLVLSFKVEQLCGEESKIIGILESMYDFGVRNRSLVSISTLSRIGVATQEIYSFVIEKKFSQTASRLIYSRHLLFWLLD